LIRRRAAVDNGRCELRRAELRVGVGVVVERPDRGECTSAAATAFAPANSAACAVVPESSTVA